MRDYQDLIRRLRDDRLCWPEGGGSHTYITAELGQEAAAAIEELLLLRPAAVSCPSAAAGPTEEEIDHA